MNEIMKIVIDIKNNNKEIEYYGKYSLNNLMIFVAGYTYKLWNKGVKNLEFFPGLDEFVLKYYDLDKNYKIFKNKIDIISFFSHNEEEALNTFYNLLDQFLYIKGDVSWKKL